MADFVQNNNVNTSICDLTHLMTQRRSKNETEIPLYLLPHVIARQISVFVHSKLIHTAHSKLINFIWSGLGENPVTGDAPTTRSCR